jgi:transposase InsO family protein
MIDELSSQHYSIMNLCAAFDVPRSTYYRHKSGSPSGIRKRRYRADEAEFITRIEHLKSAHPFWGYRRIWAWLTYRDHKKISRRRVYRIMKENDLLVKPKQYKAKRKPGTSKPRAHKPNQFWGIDMSKFFVQGLGWLYLVIVLDWFSKKVVGYKIDTRSRSKEWIEALDMAVIKQCPDGSRHHTLCLVSDNGSQPTSVAFMRACNTLTIKHITTSYSNPKGNADTERFMRTFKEEVVWPYEYETYEQAVQAVDDFIQFYNEEYPNSALGYQSPEQFEKEQKLKNAA